MFLFTQNIRNRIQKIPKFFNFLKIDIIVARTLLRKKRDAKSKLPIVTRRAVVFLIRHKNVPWIFASEIARPWNSIVFVNFIVSRMAASGKYFDAEFHHFSLSCVAFEKSELESASLSLSRFLFCDAQRSYIYITVVGTTLGRENYIVFHLL